MNVELRQKLIADFQGAGADITGDSLLCIGFALVVELMDNDGERHLAIITSDASGKSLPWYTVNGLADALREEDDFDANEAPDE